MIIAFSVLATFTIGIVAYYISTKSNSSLRKDIIEMQGKKVDLSFVDSDIFHSGHDTVYTMAKTNKLIVFVDSMTCSSCFLNKMPYYIDYDVS